ncbi:MAG TPA: hypothetical protein PKA28_06155 [Methylomusa anaerophila]|uniref:Uncharacterized protein n=1 Tax=Methylomusa anaerophila TaxID=1930071 RepID=A0A348ALM4_9FIRM|nr:hypothetical protein [Methylomusa anaerophila]BBB91972.1 hypothetical protein MAMMFC1_02657 [Methylomusa anaerophila]HML88016.1 hypothetical protein [Methylomusa anaerophila]
MKRAFITGLFLLALLIAPVQTPAAGNADLIWQWAPVIYQQDDHQNPIARENVFTVVNFDRDWRTNNNWINLPYYSPNAAVYYSLVESDTHYFIGYYLYYPRHAGGTNHEHDMIGAMAVVQKKADKSGQLELLLTYSNNEWLKLGGSQVKVENGHPILTVRAGTHGISNRQAPGTGGTYPLLPNGARSDTTARGNYQLVDLQELWQNRNDIGQNRTFSRWGYFDSNSYLNTGAPWAWQYRGINWLAKPAELAQLIQGVQNKPGTYLTNPYSSVR